jgi:hypothetical protein
MKKIFLLLSVVVLSFITIAQSKIDSNSRKGFFKFEKGMFKGTFEFENTTNINSFKKIKKYIETACDEISKKVEKEGVKVDQLDEFGIPMIMRDSITGSEITKIDSITGVEELVVMSPKIIYGNRLIPKACYFVKDQNDEIRINISYFLIDKNNSIKKYYQSNDVWFLKEKLIRIE